MKDKYYCVINAEGSYIDLVLARDVPAPSKQVLDLGEIGVAEMSPSSWETVSGVMPADELVQLDDCKAVSDCPYMGMTEDKRVFCYAPGAEGETAALLIIDQEHSSIFRFIGPLTLKDNEYILKNGDSDTFIKFTFEWQEGGMIEQIQDYTLGEGESLVLVTEECKQPTTKVYVGTPGYIRPRWNGTAWVEGATAEEIAVWEAENPAPVFVQRPTPEEDTDALMVDHEYRLTLLELGVTNDAV